MAREPDRAGDNPARTEETSRAGLLDPLTTPTEPGWRVGSRMRNWFLTGLIVVGPVSITLYIAWWFISLVDGWVKPLVPEPYLPDTYLPFDVPGVGLIFAILALILIGALTANLFGRTIVSYAEDTVARMPIVRGVYRTLKQIFETVLSNQGSSFQKVGVIEFPSKGLYSLVFLAADTADEITQKVEGGRPMISVFLPCTPNPTTGFLVFVPKEDVVEIDITVEEAAKMLISAGLIVPERQTALRQLVEEKRAEDGVAPEPPIVDQPDFRSRMASSRSNR